ncbi:MAG: hypothetical protein ACRDHF_05115, partial [Tepidiformaceae bacterium]
GLGAGLAAGCGSGSRSPLGPEQRASGEAAETRTAEHTATPEPSPTPTPTPAPQGREERTLLPGSPWETPLHIASSGVSGPVLLVLGGVHGNEPGGWGAAEGIAAWEPARGRLLTIPHANREAIALFARTTDQLGDLNRLYPGKPDSEFPMERMAAEIVAMAKEYRAEIALDLHESWAFYAERTQSGTAFLGQTVTWGVGPANPGFGQKLVERANSGITIERDRLIQRDGSMFRRSDGSSVNGDTPGQRGRSSLSLGGHVPGLTPILVEMGQQGQPLERRVELHLMVVRAAMDELGM